MDLQGRPVLQVVAREAAHHCGPSLSLISCHAGPQLLAVFSETLTNRVGL